MLWDVLAAALRQWRVLVPLLALTVALTLMLGGAIDSEHSADSALLLVGPNAAAARPAQQGDDAPPRQLNPYLSFNDSLLTTAHVIGYRLTSAGTRETLTEAGLSTTHEVTLDNRSPIIQIRARGDDAETAATTLNRLIDIASEELVQLQSAGGAPDSQLIAVDLLATSTDETSDARPAGRVRFLLLGLGVVGSVVIASASDRWLAWSRHRWPRASSPGGHNGDHEPAHARSR